MGVRVRREQECQMKNRDEHAKDHMLFRVRDQVYTRNFSGHIGGNHNMTSDGWQTTSTYKIKVCATSHVDNVCAC